MEIQDIQQTPEQLAKQINDLCTNQNYQQSFRFAERFIEQYPTNHLSYQTYAWVLYKQSLSSEDKKQANSKLIINLMMISISFINNLKVQQQKSLLIKSYLFLSVYYFQNLSKPYTALIYIDHLLSIDCNNQLYISKKQNILSELSNKKTQILHLLTTTKQYDSQLKEKYKQYLNDMLTWQDWPIAYQILSIMIKLKQQINQQQYINYALIAYFYCRQSQSKDDQLSKKFIKIIDMVHQKFPKIIKIYTYLGNTYQIHGKYQAQFKYKRGIQLIRKQVKQYRNIGKQLNQQLTEDIILHLYRYRQYLLREKRLEEIDQYQYSQFGIQYSDFIEIDKWFFEGQYRPIIQYFESNPKNQALKAKKGILALAYEYIGQFENAENIYEQILKNYKTLSSTDTSNYAQLLSKKSDHLQEAERLAKLAVLINKNSYHQHYNYGKILEKKWKVSEAEIQYEQCYELGGKNQLIILLGLSRFYCNMKNIEKFTKCIKRIQFIIDQQEITQLLSKYYLEEKYIEKLSTIFSQFIKTLAQISGYAPSIQSFQNQKNLMEKIQKESKQTFKLLLISQNKNKEMQQQRIKQQEKNEYLHNVITNLEQSNRNLRKQFEELRNNCQNTKKDYEETKKIVEQRFQWEIKFENKIEKLKMHKKYECKSYAMNLFWMIMTSISSYRQLYRGEVKRGDIELTKGTAILKNIKDTTDSISQIKNQVGSIVELTQIGSNGKLAHKFLQGFNNLNMITVILSLVDKMSGVYIDNVSDEVERKIAQTFEQFYSGFLLQKIVYGAIIFLVSNKDHEYMLQHPEQDFSYSYIFDQCVQKKDNMIRFISGIKEIGVDDKQAMIDSSLIFNILIKYEGTYQNPLLWASQQLLNKKLKSINPQNQPRKITNNQQNKQSCSIF